MTEYEHMTHAEFLFALKIHKFYLVAETSSLSNDLECLRRTATELRLLTKHNPENRIRIARDDAR